MNNSHALVALAALSLAALGARHDRFKTPAGTVRLPTYTVTVPRRNEVERQIAHSLDHLRAAARVPLPLKVTPPLWKAANTPRHSRASFTLVPTTADS